MKKFVLLRSFKKMQLSGFVLFALVIILAFSSNPPNGKTGAPGDGSCSESGCHGGSGAGLDGDISISGLPSSITANTTYPITITLDNPNGAANRAGFQWVVLDGINQNAGTLSNASASTTIATSGGRSYHEHQGSTNFPASNSISWTADWTAPAGPNGDAITIYGVGNIANGSGSGGDRIVFTNATGTLAATVVMPTATITSSNDVTCNSNTDGTATVTAASGTPGYNYLWDNGETNATAIALNAGTHTVTVTDSANETATASVVINEPAAINITETAHQDITCFGDNDGSSTVSASGGNGTFSYAWSEGSTGSTVFNLSAGNYNVTATDINNCTSILSISIFEPAQLDYSETSINDISCFGFADGSIIGSAIGGTSGFNYNWSNGANTNNITNLNAGPYSVTVTDVNSCTYTESFTITEPIQLDISVSSQTDETCNNDNNGSATVAATGGTLNYSYSWSNGASGATQTNLQGGTYTVTVTDQTGCTNSTSVVIANGLTIVPSVITFVSPTCSNTADGQMTASASGGTNYTYNWSNGSTGATVTGLLGGSYALTVTDVSGCTASINTGLVQPAAITINTLTQDNISCNNANDGSLSVSATGGVGTVGFNWSNGQTGNMISNLAPGTYEVTATDDNGCSSTSLFAISQPSVLAAMATSQTDVTCFGGNDGSATITVTGGTSPYAIQWPSGNTTGTESNLAAGSYSLLITDNNNCQTTTQIQITEPQILLANSTSTPESAAGANDGTATVAPTGGTSPYTYLWSNGSTDDKLTGLTPATYNVTITDMNNCVITTSVSVSSGNCTLAATVDVTNLSCYQSTNGSITLTATNVVGSPTINWSNGAMNMNTISNLTTGLYSVTITDGVPCEVIINDIFVSRPDTLIATADIVSSPECSMDTNGELSYNAIGGTAPYQILWSTGAISDTITDNAVGMYAFTITDANGCTADNSVMLNHLDTIAPAMILSLFTLYLDDMGNIPSYDENNFIVTSFDNCATAGYNFTQVNTTCDSIGLFNIDVTLFDVNGNASMASTTMAILDMVLYHRLRYKTTLR